MRCEHNTIVVHCCQTVFKNKFNHLMCVTGDPEQLAFTKKNGYNSQRPSSLSQKSIRFKKQTPQMAG